MKKGIKFRKLKRKARNIVLWAITWLAMAMILASSVVFAFGNPTWVHNLMFAGGSAWCWCFACSNTRGE